MVADEPVEVMSDDAEGEDKDDDEDEEGFTATTKSVAKNIRFW